MGPAIAEPRKEKLQGNFMGKGPEAEKSFYVRVVSLFQDGRGVHGKLGKEGGWREKWTCVLTKLLIIPKMLEPPEATFYQENTPTFSLPTK